MKICMVAEGCYPYVVGGVSGWIHSMIRSFPNIEFIVLSVIPNRNMSGKFVYELPVNVSAVYEAYLEDYDWGRKPKHGKRTRLNRKEYLALRSVILDQDVDWDTLFDMFQGEKFFIDDLLMGADFLSIVKEVYNYRYPQIVFSDFLWTMRSIYLPLFLVLKTPIPQADIYHCVSTGYAGVLGCMARHLYRSALLVSEHGIYTREREEELLKASWVAGIYKNIWIDQFRKMSLLAYMRADRVTCLYIHAKELQVSLGCPEDKISVTPNGIDVKNFENLSGKLKEDEGFINIGAVLRVAPIKDVKTMIRAFAFAKEDMPSLKLWIMGPTDEDEEYAQECFDLVDTLQVPDVIFTGRINVTEYLGRMDFTILTSISEGQPLTILESYAAHKPVIATDVGCCRELIYGTDDFGTAGILTHIMNTTELAAAMVEMGRSASLRQEMGESGYKRVTTSYQIQQMKKAYENLYRTVGWEYGSLWPESSDERLIYTEEDLDYLYYQKEDVTWTAWAKDVDDWKGWADDEDDREDEENRIEYTGAGRDDQAEERSRRSKKHRDKEDSEKGRRERKSRKDQTDQIDLIDLIELIDQEEQSGWTGTAEDRPEPESEEFDREAWARDVKDWSDWGTDDEPEGVFDLGPGDEFEKENEEGGETWRE